MSTATAQTYQPKKKYYDLAAERIRAQKAALEARSGPSAWLQGREAHQARLAAEAKAAKGDDREWLAPQTVGSKVERYMEAVGKKAYAEVASALPRHVKLKPVEPNGQSLVKHPHLGFTMYGTFDVRNRDGTTTTFNLFAANFRANPAYKDGRQMFDNIPEQIDGVKNGAMLYAHAVNKNTGLPDNRFAANPDLPGVAFRLGDVKKVADACVRLAGPAPIQRQQMHQPTAPRQSMEARGMAHAYVRPYSRTGSAP